MLSDHPYSLAHDAGVAPYQSYSAQLAELVRTMERGGATGNGAFAQDIKAALNGGSSTALRALVSRATRRETGAFFTDSGLATLAWSRIGTDLSPNSMVLDPTCGTGSLLLPAVQAFVELGATSQQLDSIIYGLDRQPEFVTAAQERLKLAVLNATLPTQAQPTRIPVFSNVFCDDIFARSDLLQSASHIVLNPPYLQVPAPNWLTWGRGAVNQAAVIMDWSVLHMTPGARAVAILPDVLRSGSRYRHWRRNLSLLASVDSVESWGRFDKDTDVDVFVLALTRDNTRGITRPARAGYDFARLSNAEKSAKACIANDYDVSVGSVVNYRDALEGPQRAYLTARGLPVGGITRRIGTKRKFSGRCFEPPFVVVRRTTSPRQSPRAQATVVTGKRLVAVDNHLIVLKSRNRPEDVSIHTELAIGLSSVRVSKWLNERYRCRHLPVSAVSQLPNCLVSA